MLKYTFILIILISYFSQAEEIDSLEKTLLDKIENGVYDSDTRLLFNNLSHRYRMQAPYRGIQTAYKIMEYAINKNLDTLEYDCYNVLGGMYSQLGIIDQALGSYLNAQAFYDDTVPGGAYYWTTIDIGNIYYFQKNLDKAEKYYNKSLEGFRKLRKKEEASRYLDSIENLAGLNGMAVSLNNLGLIYRKKGDFKKSLDCHSKALNLRKKIADINKKEVQGIAHSYGYIGYCHDLLDNNETAMNYYRKALDILKDTFQLDNLYKTNYIQFLAQTYSRMGTLHLKLKNYKKAESSLKESIKLFREIHSPGEIISSLNYLSDLYFEKGDTKQSLDYMFEALEIAKQHEFFLSKAEIYIRAIAIYKRSGNYEKALQYSSRLHMIDSTLFNRYINTALRGVENDFALKQHTEDLKLLKHQNKLKEIDISRQNTIIISLIIISVLVLTALGIIYYLFKLNKKTNKILEEKNNQLLETNKKLLISESKLEKINEKLNKKNISLEESEKILRELNLTKDKFFSIIAHDLRGPISSLMHVTELVHNYFDDLPENEKKDFLMEMKKSTAGLYNLLENLLTWSRSQRGTISFVPDRLNLSQLTKNIFDIMKISAENKNIALETNIPEKIEVFADFNMVNTILRNLISNAIKFTREGGKVQVSTRIRDDFIEISVSDTGIGIPEKIAAGIFDIGKSKTTQGTAGEKGTGLGLVLCKEFVEKHGGTLKVNSTEGAGSTFYFTLPKLKTAHEPMIV